MRRPEAMRAKPPLIRFLAAAGKPLGIKYSPGSWRGGSAITRPVGVVENRIDCAISTAPAPDVYVRATMDAVRAKSQKPEGAAKSAALIALARLLSRQAAHEWANRRSAGNPPAALSWNEK